ncbi:type II secretion system F family protein [Phenylobacterium montanum]|uniref:Type II secretion system F family protein n=1 Tax=Phenylobacterium montanum TaxID=2823693 RepID=A0A975G589_9CAUL|nr:type II secretion system F family protein [Caulobacter sp. S6]QUD90818.1 type II secretion system F family protein [Caulobacter sp. S6]
MLTILVALLGFVVVAGLGFAFAGNDGPGAKTMKRAQAVSAGGGARIERSQRAKATDQANRRKQLLVNLKEQERAQRKATLSIDGMLRQAGLEFSARQFWIASGVMALITLGATAVMRAPWPVMLGAPVAAGLGLPRWVLGFLAGRRRKRFIEHFSDAIDIIVRGIKSGLPVHDCLKIIARESPAPLGPEFQGLVENLAMGVAIDQGLEKMYARMPTSELRFFTIVLAIQQKTGGNLAEALGNLSTVLRARKLMREKIKALSSEATASAMIIGCLPPGVVVLITVTTPSYMSVMFTDPRGHMMLMGGAIWMSAGIYVMRKMINFKF